MSLIAIARGYHGQSPGELDWTKAQRQKRTVAEHLEALDAGASENPRADESDGAAVETPRQRRYERKPPKVISPSDPCSAWTVKANKRVQFG